METIRKVEACRGCGGHELDFAFSLGDQSITGFHQPGQTGRRGPLDMVFCRTCSLSQLGHTYPGDWFYDWYGYRSGTNPMMVRALGELVERLQPHLKVGDSVLDIGSNDGTLLRLYHTAGIRRVGVDPVKNLGPVARDGLHLFVNDYFRSAHVRQHCDTYGKFKVVTMCAMFYELEDPVGFLRDVVSVLDDDGLVVIQMNYLKTQLETNGYDNIVHEHQTYFSLLSLLPVLARSGLRALDVEINDVNGGSFRVWACKNAARRTIAGGSERIMDMVDVENAARIKTDAPLVSFYQRICGERDRLRLLIDRINEEGSAIYVYGASTRGLAIMEFTGIDADDIVGAAERNPDKIGRMYAGTGIPCVPEDEARNGADFMLVLPHHFLADFVQRESEWLANGGLFIVPLPEVRLVGAHGVVVSQEEAFA
jgi:SAM-dependent methyltransferase